MLNQDFTTSSRPTFSTASAISCRSGYTPYTAVPVA
jgi:hypothetical protein